MNRKKKEGVVGFKKGEIYRTQAAGYCYVQDLQKKGYHFGSLHDKRNFQP